MPLAVGVALDRAVLLKDHFHPQGVVDGAGDVERHAAGRVLRVGDRDVRAGENQRRACRRGSPPAPRRRQTYRALDAGAFSRRAQAALQLVAVFGNAAQVDGLHDARVDYDGLGDPDGAVEVRPVFAVGGRLDGAGVSRAEAAVDVAAPLSTRACIAVPGMRWGAQRCQRMHQVRRRGGGSGGVKRRRLGKGNVRTSCPLECA